MNRLARIIFSKDIHCTDYADDNVLNLIDTKGFDIVKGYDICCHYTNRDTVRNAYEFQCISDYVAMGNKVFALPEETSLFLYPGLGSLKRFSIMHHLQLIAKYIDKLRLILS